MSDEDYEQGFSEGYDQGLSTDKEKSFLILAARIDELKKENARLRAELAAVTEERDRMQIMHDSAYISGMKHGWNCCAAGEEERYKNSIENIREQIRRARAAIEGVTAKSGAGNE